MVNIFLPIIFSICFGWELRQIFFCYTLLTKGLHLLKTSMNNSYVPIIFSDSVYTMMYTFRNSVGHPPSLQDLHFLSFFIFQTEYINLDLSQSYGSVNVASLAIWSLSMFEEYADDNYYSRFDTYSYHCCRGKHFTMSIYVNVTGAWNVGQGHQVIVCWKTI